jgi:hypothetical protein
VAPVVGFCAAHPPTEWEKVAEPLPEPNDPPVKPEPGTRTEADEESVPAGTSPSGAKQEAPGAVQQDADLDAFQERVRNGWNHLGATEMALAEAKAKGINPVVPFEGDHLHIQDVLEIRLKALKEKAAQGGATEGKAA